MKVKVVLVIAGATLLLAGSADAAAAASLYWTNAGNGTIARANSDGSGVNENFIASTAYYTGLAVDGQHIYWNTGSATARANLDGSGVNDSFIPDSGALAVNGQYVYWSHSPGTGTASIYRANLDGSGIDKTFITGLDGGNVTGIAVDGQYIYWSNYWDSAIGRAKLDGSDVNQRFINGTHTPLGIAVDAHHIYWAITFDNTIGRANIDGSGADLKFITGVDASGNQPVSVAVDGQHIYWTNGGDGTIGRADLDGSGVDQSFITGANSPQGLAVALPPSNVTPPSITGRAVQGATLSEAHGSWTLNPTSYAYQWLRCDTAGRSCAPMAGATQQTYTAGLADVGHTLRVQELASNLNGGTSPPATSPSTSVVKVEQAAPSIAIRAVSPSGPTVSVSLSCDGPSGTTCTGDAVLTAQAMKRARTLLRVDRGGPLAETTADVATTVGQARFSVPASDSETVRVKLNRTGRRRLDKSYRLATMLTLIGPNVVSRPVTFHYTRIHPIVVLYTKTTGGTTTLLRLTIGGLTHGARVTIRCSGHGCPFKRETIKPRTGRITISRRLAGARLPAPGATVVVTITAPDAVAFVKLYRTVKDALPSTACGARPPGTHKVRDMPC